MGDAMHLASRKASRWDGPALWPFDRRVICADLALLATVGAIVGIFALSPVTLEGFGISYVTSGGGVLTKVHPSTLIAVLALVLRCLSTQRPLRTAWRLATDDAGVVLLLGAFAIAVFYALRIAHTPFTPLIDTFVLPALVFLLLRDIDPTIRRALAIIVGLLFCANAVIAITEYLRHWHFIKISVPAGATSDPMRGNATFDWRAELANDWRATALLGHPLSNGLATGAFIMCLAAAGTRWIPLAVKVPIVLLQAVAMLAFGARTALVLSIGSTLWLVGSHSLVMVREGRRIGPRQMALFLVAIAVCVLLASVLADSGFADRMIERFQNDQGSATTRIAMFNLFDPLSWSDILLGPDPDQIATLQRLEGLEFGIESSWVGLVLAYGLVVTLILVTGLAAFARSLLRTAGRGTGFVLAYFFILVSVAATLSTKTTIFAMTVAMVLIFLERDVRPSQARSTPRLGAL